MDWHQSAIPPSPHPKTQELQKSPVLTVLIDKKFGYKKDRFVSGITEENKENIYSSAKKESDVRSFYPMVNTVNHKVSRYPERRKIR